MFARTLKTSLLMADCSIFLTQRQGTFSRRSSTDVSVLQPVLRSMTSAGVVDQEVLRLTVERQPGRLAQVHGHTGRPARPVCTLFALAHEAGADGKAVVWCGHIYWHTLKNRNKTPWHVPQNSGFYWVNPAEKLAPTEAIFQFFLFH